jgi:NADPH-dependent 2,4-dienoyl-CoA reductase/sulfur reductase-like enzyme
MKRRVVIIGGGAAGMSAAAKARRTDAELDIVVYERSGFVSYGACGFPYAIKGEIARIEDVIVRTPEQFARQGIQALIHHEVLAIDTERQTVRVRDLTSGREFVDHWDELVLTTGGQPVRPPLSGVDLPGVFTLRNVEDAQAIQHWLHEQQPRTGVIIGGGYIGLEMAEALAAHGMQLTLIERLSQVLPGFDSELAA